MNIIQGPIESDDPSDEDELFTIDEEFNHEYEPCENGKYYLGSYKYFPELEEILLMSQISMHVFYASHYNSLRNFIYWYSGTHIPDTRVQIMQVSIKNQFATAVLKTHWIRIIQRTWKRVFRERRRYIQNRKKLSIILSNQRQAISSTYYPELRGMLSFLQKSSPSI
jgi:hypothetical protein